MNMSGMTVVFYILAAVIILSAIGVVTLRNIVHSALCVVLTFIGVAGIYFMLHADFLGGVQLMVYAGAISILLAFGVMLTVRGNMKESNLANGQWGIAAFTAAALFAVINWILGKTVWPDVVPKGTENSVEQLADLMLGNYLVPFETAAILLTMAMIGAIVIAKEVKNSK